MIKPVLFISCVPDHFYFHQERGRPYFLSCAGAAEQVRCGLRALMRSPVSSGGAFYILHLHHQGNDNGLSGTDLYLYLFSFSYLLTFFSSFLPFFLSHSHHQHLYTDIPSGKSSLPSAALEHTLFHAWSWHAHPWCDLTWSLKRHHLFSQQFPHFTICMSLRSPEHLPASLQSLKGMTTEHDQALGLMSCRDMGRGLKMEWERHEH